MRIKNSLIIAFLLIIITSCSEDIRFHSYIAITSKGWDKNDTLSFNLPNKFEPGDYKLSVELRHTDSYKYKNLWLEIRNNCNDSTTFQLDSIQMELADKEGNWNGSGIGGLYQYNEINNKIIHVKDSGSSYKIRINQIMRDNPIININDIGIKLSKVSN